ncbi:LytTR family DNA-binding domain-containing protein [Paenibacillus sp. YN15]|uniref:LytR/AlgR family response regulator transcription factor n=1 Tax=Paenibacillus sp. YN15 TaxID=1742774 RepID=UPI000DCC0A93|nr:LytTR family DNA-binding domain-containing protein [Paenibacillus sp. YN15]RAU96856.1 DNA-binding response regulator [Paenibacillus sp. YN15]
MFQVAICDDETEIHAVMQKFFERFSVAFGCKFDVHFFICGEDLLQYYRKCSVFPFHILILDIEMEGLTGIELANTIRLLPDREVQIAYLTSHPNYIMSSLEAQPFQYWIKPIAYDFFAEKMSRLCQHILSSTHRFLYIQTKTGHLLLRHSSIIAIKKVKHTIVQNQLDILTDSGSHAITETLQGVLRKLGGYPFVLIHRSIIVNLYYIQKFTSTSVTMTNGHSFPIGRSHATELQAAYAKFLTAHFQKERDGFA